MGALIGAYAFPSPVDFGVCLLGSVSPDLDHPRSLLGRKLPFVSSLAHGYLGHRGALHSLLGLMVWLWGLIWLLPSHLAFAFVWGYGSHLILDGLTKGGIPIFWPFSAQRGGFGLGFRSGGLMDYAIGLGSLLAALWKMSQAGFFLGFTKAIGAKLGVMT